MARPQKPDADKRELVIRLRVTLSEKSHILRNAKNAGLTSSDFLRGLAINAKPARSVPTPDRELLLRLLAEINMNGSNLNQIARALNRKQDSGELRGFDDALLNNTLHGVGLLTKLLMDLLQK